jgi:hypothetical protein
VLGNVEVAVLESFQATCVRWAGEREERAPSQAAALVPEGRGRRPGTSQLVLCGVLRRGPPKWPGHSICWELGLATLGAGPALCLHQSREATLKLEVRETLLRNIHGQLNTVLALCA